MKRIVVLLIGVLLIGSLSAHSHINDGGKRVILIGSDGLSAKVIRENPSLFPNILQLFSEGSGTLECRSVLPSSSAVNWASHLMGAGPELHGYTDWGSKTPELNSRTVTENGTFPCIVWSVRQSYPNDEIGVIYSWDGIGYLFDTTSVSYNYAAKSDREVVDKSLEFLKKNPRFAFFYLAEPDGAGHSKGWDSEEYKAASAQIDTYVGELVAGIKSSLQDVTIIFVSDHGGINTGHGGKTMNEMQTPFVIAGDGIKQGFTITDSQMNFDTAPTIAHILGSPSPQVWIGRTVSSVFESDVTSQVVGKKFSITLDSNPTTGYQWQVKSAKSTDSSGTINLYDSEYVSFSTSGSMTGVGGEQTFYFKATKGTYLIRMEYIRSWEHKAVKSQTYKFTVK